MPNLVAVLRDEIKRLARKEIKKTVDPLRKDNTRLKREVAALKRQVSALTTTTKRLISQTAHLRQKAIDPEAKEFKEARLGPKYISALRRRLKLTREDFALLLEVSGNTVYLWENGRTSPRAEAKARLVDLRRIGVREARRRVEEAT